MDETKKSEENKRRNGIGAAILVIFSVLIVAITVWRYPKFLSAPFSEYGQDKGLWKSQTEQDLEKIAAMKTKDTDGDGLTDYDETYLYQTSPYLADSDSDGFSDKDEIASGNDPNCPAGQACTKIEDAAAKAAPVAGEPSEEDTGLGGFLSGTATAAEVRDALRQAGVSDETLSKLDDATLLELYTETLKEAGGGTTGTISNSNANTNSGLPTNTNASEMTPDQLREILRQAGVDEATLKSVDDATLMKIFEETVQKNQNP
jgi:hypothetical protein